MHNEKLRNLYSLNIIRMVKLERLRWAWHVPHMGKKRNAYKVMVGKPEEKRPLGKPRCRREDNIEMDIRGLGWGSMDWIHLAEDRNQCEALVNIVMNFWVP
jgi:hypothetical protein